jgi:hypothetical protein
MENHANVIAVHSLIFDADGEPLLVLTSVFPTTYAELVRVTSGTPAEVA